MSQTNTSSSVTTAELFTEHAEEFLDERGTGDDRAHLLHRRKTVTQKKSKTSDKKRNLEYLLLGLVASAALTAAVASGFVRRAFHRLADHKQQLAVRTQDATTQTSDDGPYTSRLREGHSWVGIESDDQRHPTIVLPSAEDRGWLEESWFLIPARGLGNVEVPGLDTERARGPWGRNTIWNPPYPSWLASETRKREGEQ